MQHHLVGVGVAHLGDLLALRDLLAFLHQDLAVVRVRRQPRRVVLDDDELAVAADARSRRRRPCPRRSRRPAGPALPAMSMPLRFGFSETPVTSLPVAGHIQLGASSSSAGLVSGLGSGFGSARAIDGRGDRFRCRRRRRRGRDALDVAQRLLGVRLLQRLRLRLVVVGVARARATASGVAERRSGGSRVADPTGGTVRSGVVVTPVAAGAGSPGAARRNVWPSRITLMFSIAFHAASSR